MAGGISLHVVDATIGRPAHGMRVEVFALTPSRRLIAAGTLGADGTDHPRARGAGIADIAQHYHLPLKTTPWGFSMYRGG